MFARLLSWGLVFALVPSSTGFAQDVRGQRPDPTPGASREAEFEELDLANLLELDFVVSSTKLSTSLNEAPSIVTVVSRRDIERWGYRTVAEALEKVLGFYVVDDHITPNVAVRGVAGGLRAERSIVKVMIDGQPVSYRPTSGNWLGPELIPIGAVEQIEVIRGPASALYGADAFMGVVNIITSKGERAKGANFRFAGSMVNENPGFGVDAVGGQQLGQVEVLAGARYDREDRSGLSLPSTSPSPNVPLVAGEAAEDLRMISASAYLRMTYRPALQSFLSIGGYFSLQDRQAAFAEWAQLTASDGQEGTRLNRFNSAILTKANVVFSDEFTLTFDGMAFFGSDSDDNRIEVASPDFYVQQKQDFRGTDLQLGAVWTPASSLTIVLGSGIIVDAETLGRTSLVLKEGDQTPRVVAEGEDQTFINPGLYAQANWRAVPDYLTLTGGVRYDFHNIYGSQVSGRFGVVSNPIDYLYLKVLYGSAFKAPSPVLLYGRPAQSGDIIGNPDLEPQFVHTVEGQIIAYPADQLSLGTTVAYSYVRNLAVFSRSGFNNAARNVVELGTVSWESYAKFNFSRRLGGYLKYEMLFSKRNAGDEGFQAALLGDEAGVFPNLQFKGGVWGELRPAHLRASVEVRYIGERRASDLNILANNASYELDPYWVVDATVGSVDLKLFGEESETVIEFIGRNLLDTDASHPGEAGVDYPIVPRTLLLQLRQTL